MSHRWSSFVVVFTLIPFSAGVSSYARPAVATTVPGHVSRAQSPEFDEKTALKYSQSAIGRTLADYLLYDREGRPVHLADYRGRPLVISLVYTSCYHICPTTTRHLAKVVRRARATLGDHSFNVVTIGFDTANDTPEAMRLFAIRQGVDVKGWKFLSGNAVTMDRLARNLGFVYFASPKGFDHLIQATLVNADGKIYRQVYGMNFDTPLLVDPLKELVFGEQPHQTVLGSLWSKVRLFCTTYDPASDSYRFDYAVFVGMAIGLAIIGSVGLYLIREIRRNRLSRRI